MDSLKKRIYRYIALWGMLCVMGFWLVACGRDGEQAGEAILVSPTSGPTAEPVESPAQTSAPTQAPTPGPTETTISTQAPTPGPTETTISTQAPTPGPTETTPPTQVPTPEPAETPTPPPVPDITGCPVLSVEGTKLVDENGNQVQLRGVSTHGLAWYPGYVNEECFRQLKEEWGANVVRLAMYTAEYGGYCTGGDKEALKALVKDGVEYATDLGLYVIIDWHILSDGNPNTYLQESKDFFGEMAESYADYTNVLYEICNEPNGGTTWSQVKEYAEQVIPVIREKDEDGIILVGTPNWCQYVDQAAADPITDYENIMYTLHFYAATHTDSLRNNMVTALEAGLPLFVSEYGICDASGSGNIDTHQADRWVELMDEYRVSYVAWNLSNKAETSAFFKQDCSKLSGFTADDLSASGKWVYEMLRERAGDITGGEHQPTEAPTVSTEPTENPTEAPAVSTEPTENPTEAPIVSTESTPAPTDTSGSPEIPEATIDLGLAYEATIVNSWEQEGDTCAQYTLTITNGSDTSVETWSISLPFEQEIAVISSWNGNFQVEGNVLTITPVDYNSHIQAGGSIKDIGFILQIMQK